MRRLFLIGILLLVWTRPSAASITFTKTQTGCINEQTGAGSTGNNCSFGNNPGTGHLVTCSLVWTDGTNLDLPAVISVADNSGNSYAKSTNSPVNTANSADGYLYYLLSAPANADKLVIATYTSYGGAGASFMSCEEWTVTLTGGTTLALVGDITGTGTTGDINGPTVTASGNPTLMYCLGVPANSLTGAGLGSWTAGGNGSPGSMTGIMAEYQTAASTNQACSFTQSPSGGWNAIGISFAGTGGCTPSKVVFTGQPSNAVVGAALGTVSVSVEDSGSSVCTGDTSTVTITNNAGCTGMTLGGTASGAAVAGVFTTTNLTENAVGTCTLHAADGALTVADSNSFTVSAAPTSNFNLLLLGSGATASSSLKSFTTSFPATENPISQSGKWLSGATSTGSVFRNVQTDSTKAYGTAVQTAGVDYADSLAILSDSWQPNVTIIGTIVVNVQSGTNGYELELLGHMRFGSSGVRYGYEFVISVKSAPTPQYYYDLVRLEGAPGSFTILTGGSPQLGVTPVTGDQMKLVFSGSSISLYYKNVLLTTVTDSTYPTGRPGLGFDPFNYGSGNPALTDAGFSAWQVTEN